MLPLLDVKVYYHDVSADLGVVPKKWGFRTRSFRGIKYPASPYVVNNYEEWEHLQDIYLCTPAENKINSILDLMTADGVYLDNEVPAINRHMFSSGMHKLAVLRKNGGIINNDGSLSVLGISITGPLPVADPVFLLLVQLANCGGAGTKLIYSSRDGNSLNILLLASCGTPFSPYTKKHGNYYYGFPVSTLFGLFTEMFFNPCTATALYLQFTCKEPPWSKGAMKLWIEGSYAFINEREGLSEMYNRLIALLQSRGVDSESVITVHEDSPATTIEQMATLAEQVKNLEAVPQDVPSPF
jgi:hypothetical protein